MGHSRKTNEKLMDNEWKLMKNSPHTHPLTYPKGTPIASHVKAPSEARRVRHDSVVTNEWQTHGGLMENSWKTYGKLMANLWNAHGKLMENIWKTCGKSMAN